MTRTLFGQKYLLLRCKGMVSSPMRCRLVSSGEPGGQIVVMKCPLVFILTATSNATISSPPQAEERQICRVPLFMRGHYNLERPLARAMLPTHRNPEYRITGTQEF